MVSRAAGEVQPPGNALTGGGIRDGISGALVVRDSTFSGNTASDSGGGIFNEGMAPVSGCTVTGNSAGVDGGGIFNYKGGTLTALDSAFSHNSPDNIVGKYGNKGGNTFN